MFLAHAILDVNSSDFMILQTRIHLTTLEGSFDPLLFSARLSFR